jgi:ubiquinone/menaquinone biosynthesis C-methylase UbiE
MPFETKLPRLRLLPRAAYGSAKATDPLRLYYWPVFGGMYRRRVELCLAQCSGGQRVLEVGFGSGLTFLNLAEMYQEIHGLDLDADPVAVAEKFRTQDIETHLRNGDVLDMPYADATFDTVLLISILEHLKPEQQIVACREIARVLKLGGQMIYGVPVERPLMVCMFRLLGYDIRKYHFSTHEDVAGAAAQVLRKVRVVPMRATPSWLGAVYEVGHFRKDGEGATSAA